jgi:hypothetical protein
VLQTVVAISLFQLGRGMTLLGLLGVAGLWSTRRAKPPRGPIAQAQLTVMNQTKVPLTIVGVVGVVIWIIAALR